MEANRTIPLPSPAEAAARAEPNLGDLPEWNLADLYPAMDSAAFADDVKHALAECAALRHRLQGQARGACPRRRARRGDPPLRGDRRQARAHHELRAASSTPSDTSDAARAQSFMADAGDQASPTVSSEPAVLPRSSSTAIPDAIARPARRRRAECAHWQAPGSTTSARTGRIQLDDQARTAVPRERHVTGARRLERGSSTRPSRRCASPSTAPVAGARADAERSCRIPMGQCPRESGSAALAKDPAARMPAPSR